MKNQIELTFSNIVFATSIFIFSLLLSKTGFAQAAYQPTYEVMCRNKAKEVAAEKYKGCMTEQRQNQVEQIRKEYKEKLASLKNHYDKELKKLSPQAGQSQKRSEPKSSSEDNTNPSDLLPEITLKKIDSGKRKQRISSATSSSSNNSAGLLPKKKNSSSSLAGPSNLEYNHLTEPSVPSPSPSTSTSTAAAVASTTQVIDLAVPIDSQINATEEPIPFESRARTFDDNNTEIVEIPTQE